MKRTPRHPTSIEAHLLIARLLAGPFPDKRQLAMALGISYRSLIRISSRNAAVGNMPPRRFRALKELAAATLPANTLDVRYNIERSPARSVEELIDLVLRAQQPGSRHLRDEVCDSLASNLVRMCTPTMDRHLAAVLMAQLALLDGALGVRSTFQVCKATLQELGKFSGGDLSARSLRSMALTALGRATSVLAATRIASKDRKEGLRRSIARFEQASQGLERLQRITSLPELPLIWAIDEHPDTRYAPGDAARRTPLSRFAGPPHRYLFWTKLALALEYMVGNQADGLAASSLLSQAERHWQNWTEQMVNHGTLEEKHVAGRGWTLRLRSMQYLHLSLFPIGNTAARRKALRREIEQLLMVAPNADYFRPAEFTVATELITRSAPPCLRPWPATTAPGSENDDSYFGIDDSDMSLLPLVRLSRLMHS